jgi:hypothetical protein
MKFHSVDERVARSLEEISEHLSVIVDLLTKMLPPQVEYRHEPLDDEIPF